MNFQLCFTQSLLRKGLSLFFGEGYILPSSVVTVLKASWLFFLWCFLGLRYALGAGGGPKQMSLLVMSLKPARYVRYVRYR